jgi:RNAse (barnase) inhibitor barstar
MDKELLLDFSGLLDEETFHEYVSKKLNFPGYYGFNLNAFWDCIRDPEQSSMPSTLIVEGISDFQSRQPDLCRAVADCLMGYVAENPDREVILRGASPSGEGIVIEDT